MTTSDEPKAGTYLAQQQADAALQARGRFAASQSAQINGTDPVVKPPGQLAEWQRSWPEPGGEEDRFGEEIDGGLPDMTRVGQ